MFLPAIRMASLRLQKSFDLLLKNRYVGCANVFGFDPSIAAYKESDGQAEYSPVKLTSLRIAHGNRIVHVETLVVFADGFRFVVHGNADDLQPLIPILVLQFHKMRNFFPARFTPGCPEIEENYFAPVSREIDCLSRQTGKRKFGSERMPGDICSTDTSGQSAMPV